MLFHKLVSLKARYYMADFSAQCLWRLKLRCWPTVFPSRDLNREEFLSKIILVCRIQFLAHFSWGFFWATRYCHMALFTLKAHKRESIPCRIFLMLLISLTLERVYLNRSAKFQTTITEYLNKASHNLFADRGSCLSFVKNPLLVKVKKKK